MSYVKYFTILLIGFLISLAAPEALLAIEKTTYQFNGEPIDVVIPSIDKDKHMLNLCIEGIRTYCQNVNRIIVVSAKPLTDQAEWFDEALYPFSKLDVAEYLSHHNKDQMSLLTQPGSKLGWYYQQLLKLYAPFIIPNISPNVLIVDSDVVFFKPVEFINESGAGLYCIGKEYHKPYFEHAKKLIPKFKRIFQRYSGISHHMLFQKPVLDDLFNTVESTHQTDFWKAFCSMVSPRELHCYGAGASEYEIYFNFVFSRTNQVKLRPLKWRNSLNLKDLQKLCKKGYHYAAFHTYDVP